MSEVFVVSDTHFGHESVCTKFKNADGSPLRPFANAEEMNEWMVDAWNKVVKPDDKVLHLGDVVINKKFLPILNRLNGSFDLIIGNHDIHFLSLLAPYFREMTSMKVKGDLIFTHVPVHEQCIERFGANVHGHLHEKIITWQKPKVFNSWVEVPAGTVGYVTEADPRYYNVSCEHTNFQPIPLDVVRQNIKDRQAAAGYVPPAAWGNGSKPV